MTVAELLACLMVVPVLDRDRIEVVIAERRPIPIQPNGWNHPIVDVARESATVLTLLYDRPATEPPLPTP